MKRRIYLDSSVLIAIAEGEAEIAERALAILDDPNDPVDIVLSEAVRLEVLPKRLREPKKRPEVRQIEALFQGAATVVSCFDQPIWQKAIEEVEKYWLQALDALHVAAARSAGADELLTAEGPKKSICKTHSLPVRSIREA